jgi:8-oxo-dGTP diphosphatase
MREVVSGFIVRDGRALLCQRPAGKSYPFMWETPGGKVEPGESNHDTLRRELREEMGIDVGALPEHSIWCGPVTSGERPVFMTFYAVGYFDGVPKALEGQGIGWFTADEMRALTLAPGNVIALDALLGVIGG